MPGVVLVGTQRQVSSVLKYLKESDDQILTIGVPGFGNDYLGEFKLFNWDDARSINTLPLAAPNDIARISYTGGTTGTPKGVMHSQYSVGTNMIAHCMENTIGDLDKVLLSTPLQHAAGPILWTALLSGAHVFFTSQFDPEEFLNLIK